MESQIPVQGTVSFPSIFREQQRLKRSKKSRNSAKKRSVNELSISIPADKVEDEYDYFLWDDKPVTRGFIEDSDVETFCVSKDLPDILTDTIIDTVQYLTYAKQIILDKVQYVSPFICIFPKCRIFQVHRILFTDLFHLATSFPVLEELYFNEIVLPVSRSSRNKLTRRVNFSTGVRQLNETIARLREFIADTVKLKSSEKSELMTLMTVL
jgi:hypothetical protein